MNDQLDRLLRANRDVLDSLADVIERQREIGYPELVPILSRVRVPAWAPLAAWPLDIPTHPLPAKAGRVMVD